MNHLSNTTVFIMTTDLTPTTDKQRYIILDALRGFALFGIILANFPEFGLWTFLSSSEQAAMPSAEIDRVVRFLQYLFVDAKFYGIFSMLFGIGFSIILSHAFERGGNGILLFYRRMSILVCIALLHLLCLWSGDILLLYALMGMLLPLVYHFSNRALLITACILIFIPVGLDLYQELNDVSFSAPIVEAWWAKANSYGITEQNFATWLRDSEYYSGVHHFLMQGAIERMYEFVDGHRPMKVLGLFMIGYYIGRNKLYAKIEERRADLKKLFCWTLAIGFPTSLLYAYSAVNGHAWGLTVHSLLYAVSALPFALCYMSGMALLYLNNQDSKFFYYLSLPGRMALTNYIGQSVIGIILFYGIGFGLGLRYGLTGIEIIAVIVFIFQMFFSHYWMKHFKFGPLEWVWRMLTYGKWLNPKR